MQPKRAGRVQPNRQVHGSCQATSPACTHPCLAPHPPFRLRTVDVMRLLSIAGLSGGLPGVAIGAAAGSCWRGRSMTAAWAMPPQPPAVAAPGAAWPQAEPPASGHRAGGLNGAHSRHAGLREEREGGGGAKRMGRPPSLCQQLQGQRRRPTTPLTPAAVGAASLGPGGQAASSRARPLGLMSWPLAPRATASRCSWDAGAVGAAPGGCWARPTQSGAPPLAAATAGPRHPLLDVTSNLQPVAAAPKPQSGPSPRARTSSGVCRARLVPVSRLQERRGKAGRSVAVRRAPGFSLRQLGACCGFGQHAAAVAPISPNSRFCSWDHSVAAAGSPQTDQRSSPPLLTAREHRVRRSPSQSDQQPWDREPAAPQTTTSSLRAACGWVSAPGAPAPAGTAAGCEDVRTMPSGARPAAGDARVAGAARGQAARCPRTAGRPASVLPGHQASAPCCWGRYGSCGVVCVMVWCMPGCDVYICARRSEARMHVPAAGRIRCPPSPPVFIASCPPTIIQPCAGHGKMLRQQHEQQRSKTLRWYARWSAHGEWAACC